ncbi:AAA family ATPase [Brachybacterium tyrofermentans]|uniref:AAA family ATPase n=1 Tax=Brachybacterium tyrofermentans TaxID=47848 RepID=A0ABW0FLE0_9MICO
MGDDFEEDGYLKVEVELKANQQTEQMGFHSVRIYDSSQPDYPLVLSKESRRKSDLELIFAKEDRLRVDALHVKSTLGSSQRALRTYVLFSGLQPVSVYQIRKSDDIESEYRRELTALVKARAKKIDISAQEDASINMSNYSAQREVRRLLRELVGSEGFNETQELLEVDGFGVSFNALSHLVSVDADSQAKIIGRLSEIRSRRPYKMLRLRQGRMRKTLMMPWWDAGTLEQALLNNLKSSILALAEYSAALEEFLGTVNYLGPLRDEPRVVWNQWNEQAHGLPVGARGEYAAAVLARMANQRIKYCGVDGEEKFGPLQDAVDEWISYLRIGESVEVKDRGKLGVGFELRVAGGMRDLTSVGVGVSQALPIIVAILACPRDATFLVEQPELHLHPAVQARLADFMTRARPDLSVVVETHSETFITRLRRRVAERELHPEQVRITFVENFGSGSETRDLALSKYGDLSEWPDGFMSSEDDDVAAILKANIRHARMAGQE